MKKILLKGYYGFGNLGDDILMIVSYKILRENFPDSEFFIFSNNTEHLRGYANREGYNQYIFKLLEARASLIDWTYQGHFNLIFNGGGGVYFDGNQGPRLYSLVNWMFRKLGITTITRIVKLMRWIFNKPNHIDCDKRVGFGVGIGPYTLSSSLLWRHLAEIGDHDTLFVRDERSLAFLSEWGFNGNKLLGTDLAFLSAYWNANSFGKNFNRKFGKKLCIVLQDWPSDRDLRFKAILDFAGVVEVEEIAFLSFDKNQDKEYVAVFSDKFQVVTWDPDGMQLKEFLVKLSSFDAIITARAHGAILGAIMGVIPICLGTSQKLIEVSKYFPSGGLLLNSDFTKEDLMDSWQQVGQNYDAMLSGLSMDVKANELNAQRARERLIELL